jgi:hypothetical protein
MIKIFRRIRRKLIDEGNLKKYLIYAIGEILLVMIGILLALQVNNWNENNKDRNTEKKLLIELKENLKTNFTKLQSDLQKELTSIESIDFVVEHINKKKEYHDSLDIYFRKALFSPDIVLSTSGYEAIRSKGFEIVHDDTLRKSIIDLYDVIYDNLISETVRLENQFWPAAVLPAIHTHFMFLDSGAKPVDYNSLLDDKKYINMILHRKHFRKQAFDLKTESLNHTKSIIKLIEDELDGNQ